MSEARTLRGRLRQVEGWLRENWPCPEPVSVRFVPKLSEHHMGWCVRTESGRLQITIELSRCEECMVDKLCHEWAHAVVEKKRKKNERHHVVLWGEVYGRIRDAWKEEDVNQFSPRPWH